MEFLTPDFVHSAEAYRARGKRADAPSPDPLRLCGLGMMATMALGWTRLAEVVDFAPILRAEFALSGFLILNLLVGHRGKPGSGRANAAEDRASSLQGVFRTFPGSELLAVIVAILVLPQLLTIERVTIPNPVEVPAAVVKCLRSYLGEFLATTFEGRALVAWPLFLTLAPARMLGLGGLSLVGSGLLVQLTIFMTGHGGGPASIVVSPSPIDLVSGGALLAAIFQGFRGAEHGPMARWALLMGVALASVLVASRFGGVRDTSASLWILSAPTNFGAVNFILGLITTTLLGSLIWRDVDMMARQGLG